MGGWTCCAVLQSKTRVSQQVYGAPDGLLSLPFLLLFCSDPHAHFRMAGSPSPFGDLSMSSAVCVTTEVLAALLIACAIFSLLL